jgi:hypothetical protein
MLVMLRELWGCQPCSGGLQGPQLRPLRELGDRSSIKLYFFARLIAKPD